MQNTKPFDPSAEWRRNFDFKPQYPTQQAEFKLDPILVFFSTLNKQTVTKPD